ncbi:MAG: hypothetical protein A3J93_03010 [Candidatus Magasanikbacteria bacterium RIFOXYC2_FULL_42_28]|uniref:Uncharacterized protein n=1 Tax=Candidatus Magasanikbacteria bacterium RIFOXYC2_FULL_42_28 TaxID=1798704 RepID=A0A1F6NU88_9BACT|nr:MAG: hypothetical protein A3J93_03010 [Candidatus Magasanikbacteria bacterium RIFOXYC2_FULL_42_28]
MGAAPAFSKALHLPPASAVLQEQGFVAEANDELLGSRHLALPLVQEDRVAAAGDDHGADDLYLHAPPHFSLANFSPPLQAERMAMVRAMMGLLLLFMLAYLQNGPRRAVCQPDSGSAYPQGGHATSL